MRPTMSGSSLPGPIALLRLRGAFLLCLLLAGVFAGLRRPAGAIGVGIGFALFLGNAALLYEIGRSLLAGGDRRTGRWVAAASGPIRLLVLGLALAGVALAGGRTAVLGACGGLFLAQVHLHLPGRRWKGAV